MTITKKGKKFLSILSLLLVGVIASYFAYNHISDSGMLDDIQHEVVETKQSPSYTPTQKALNWNQIEVTDISTKVATIEFGSVGYKAFVVGFNTKQLIPVTLYEKYSQDKVLDGIKAGDADKFVTRLAKQIQLFINEYGVIGDNIYLKFSSGFMNSPSAQDILTAYQDKGYITEVVSIQDEGKYGALTAVPNAYRSDAVYIDVGGSNSKGASWMGDKIRPMVYKYGTKSLCYSDTLKRAYEVIVAKGISDFFQYNPMAKKADLLFLGGGAAFFSTNLMVLGAADFQEVKHQQIRDLMTTLRNSPETYYGNEVYKRYTRVYDAFELLAGVSIINGVINEMSKDGTTPTVISTRTNNWAIGKSMLHVANRGS